VGIGLAGVNRRQIIFISITVLLYHIAMPLIGWLVGEFAGSLLGRVAAIAGSLLANLADKPDAGVIRALGRQRNPQAISLLITILTQPTYSWEGDFTRESAAWALGMVGEGQQRAQVSEAADVLYHTTKVDAAPAVRAQAAIALARIGDPRAIECLEWVMQHYIPERNAAIRALWRFTDARATALLVGALQDDDPLGRVLAARGLYLHNDPRGKSAMKELVTTITEPAAKQVAIRFAADLQDPALVPLFAKLTQAGHEQASIFLVLEAIDALGKYSSPEAAQSLLQLLSAPSSRIREAAALALKGTRNPDALSALHTRLAREEATRVRTAIQAALGGR
jgi:HEAT repeat protein